MTMIVGRRTETACDQKKYEDIGIKHKQKQDVFSSTSCGIYGIYDFYRGKIFRVKAIISIFRAVIGTTDILEPKYLIIERQSSSIENIEDNS